jgi:hypothetical protein
VTVQIKAGDNRAAAGRLIGPAEQAHRRRLARAVRPDQPKDLARPHAQIQPVHGMHHAKVLGQVFRNDQIVHNVSHLVFHA